MIFAVFDPSPLTQCINCSFFTFIIVSAGLKVVNICLASHQLKWGNDVWFIVTHET